MSIAVYLLVIHINAGEKESNLCIRTAEPGWMIGGSIAYERTAEGVIRASKERVRVWELCRRERERG